MKITHWLIALAALIGFIAVMADWSATPPGGPGQGDLQYFRIATGSAAGSTFPIGAALASAISNPPGSRACERGGSCGVPGLVAVANTSQGSVANAAAVASGIVDSGLIQADVVSSAFNGEGFYFRHGPLANLRVIANLYPLDLHLVARRGSGIKSVSDLVGRRVSIDLPGSGTRLNAELVMAAYGVRLDRIKAVEVDPGDAVDLFAKEELDAFFLVAGYPAQAVSDVADLGLATLVPIQGRQADAIMRRHRYFARGVIPPGTYAGIDTAARTLTIGAQWVVAAEADDDLVYAITKALWHPRSRTFLDSSHAKARLIALDNALTGVSVPVHPGASRYYRDVGGIQ
jgi:TRAP transporter TAXI family solute receptor